MFDVEIDADRHHIRRQRIEQVRGARAEVDDDLRVRREAAQESEIRSRSAGPAIEAAQIAQRALHVVARRVVLVEQLLGDDALHGTSMNVVRQATRSTLSCAIGCLRRVEDIDRRTARAEVARSRANARCAARENPCRGCARNRSTSWPPVA